MIEVFEEEKSPYALTPDELYDYLVEWLLTFGTDGVIRPTLEAEGWWDSDNFPDKIDRIDETDNDILYAEWGKWGLTYKGIEFVEKYKGETK